MKKQEKFGKYEKILLVAGAFGFILWLGLSNVFGGQYYFNTYEVCLELKARKAFTVDCHCLAKCALTFDVEEAELDPGDEIKVCGARCWTWKQN